MQSSFQRCSNEVAEIHIQLDGIGIKTWDGFFHCYLLVLSSCNDVSSSYAQVVLNTFEAQPLSEEEGGAIGMEEETANYSIKYLTSSKLMGLEVSAISSLNYIMIQKSFTSFFSLLKIIFIVLQLKDPSFRRHILVQCLILFDYLKVIGLAAVLHLSLYESALSLSFWS